MADKESKAVSQPNPNAPPDERAARKALRRPAKPLVTHPEHCCVHHYWAVVERDGTLVRGRNVVRTKKVGTGQYEVVFTGDVTNGVYVATIGRPGISTEPAGEIGVALRCCLPAGEAGKGVWVDTHNSNGSPSDRAFHLVVHTDI
jgi:hypothetical protein